MLRLFWLSRMVRDVLMFGIVNRSPAMSLTVLALLFLGLVVLAAKVSAPFIYTLF